jgi:putative endonuclease
MGRLYIGVTSDLKARIYQHKTGYFKGSHTDKYNEHMLVYFEVCPDMESAIWREKKLKDWHRGWKLRLIIENNPEWKDLSEDVCPGITKEMNDLRP